MPAAPGATPRKMLPPPMTMAICTPARRTSPISATILSIVSRSMPYCDSPMSASPDSLTRMRPYAGSLAGLTAEATEASGVEVMATPLRFRHGRDFRGEVVLFLLDALANDEQREAVYRDALAVEVLLDRLIRILDERLAEQRDFGQVLV